jgi:hypothetical protein
MARLLPARTLAATGSEALASGLGLYRGWLGGRMNAVEVPEMQLESVA